MFLIMMNMMIMVMTIDILNVATIFTTTPETGDRLGARQRQGSPSRQRSSSCRKVSCRAVLVESVTV